MIVISGVTKGTDIKNLKSEPLTKIVNFQITSYRLFLFYLKMILIDFSNSLLNTKTKYLFYYNYFHNKFCNIYLEKFFYNWQNPKIIK